MIRNLLFDLGGVIMDIERMRAVRALQALGMKQADKVLGEYAQSGPFGDLESGLITPDEFHKRMASMIDSNVSYDEIDRAFVKFLVGIPRHRLESLRQWRTKYKLYLLSNTNIIMWESEIKRQFTQEGFTINDYFDGIVTSFEAKVMKPDPAIFKYAERQLGIVPEETLFLDDSEANCEAARRLGWHAECVHPGVEFNDILLRYFDKESCRHNDD